MLHRREALLDLGRLGLGAITLPTLLSTRQASAEQASRPATARSCILIFLWGGPPHQDMWDLKPDAPTGVRSPFRPIATATPGLEVCDQMPQIARVTDRLAVIRSMTHNSNDHEISIYRSLTGRLDESVAVPNHFRRRSHFPNVSAGVTRFSPPGLLPTSVTLPGPIWFAGVQFAGTYAGFLGPNFDPYELRPAPTTDLAVSDDFLPADDGAARRLVARRGLLSLIEDEQRRLDSSGSVNGGTAGLTSSGSAGYDGLRQRAFDIVASPTARQAFDVEREDAPLRDRYGRNVYGESFLLARRLIEADVRLVTVNWMHFLPDGGTINPWDNHGGSPLLDRLPGYDLLTKPYCLPSLDQAYSALIEDLSLRGLLDETLVVLTGEFGRTPKINQQQGRDHWGACYTTVLAGGGVRGGQVRGSSDRDAAYPKSQATSPDDVLATIYTALGISPDSEIHDPQGRPHRLCEGRVLADLF